MQITIVFRHISFAIFFGKFLKSRNMSNTIIKFRAIGIPTWERFEIILGFKHIAYGLVLRIIE